MTLDPEIQALQKAVRARIDALSGVVSEKKSGVETFQRQEHAFLQLEVRRDHLSIDLWLPEDMLEESRASGIARSHPFLGEDAVKIRFERAADLARVARWIEASYAYAPNREEHRKQLEAQRAEIEKSKAAEQPSEPKPLAIELEEKPKRPPPKRTPGGARTASNDEDDEPEPKKKPSSKSARKPPPKARKPAAKARKPVKKKAKAKAQPKRPASRTKPKAKSRSKG
jgi:hypothetical protein